MMSNEFLIKESKRIRDSLRFCACNDECSGCPFYPPYGDCCVDDLKIEAANIIDEMLSQIKNMEGK